MRRHLFLGLLLASAGGACAGPTTPGAEVSEQRPVTAACEVPSRYDAMFPQAGGCVAVAAAGGQWAPRPLFAKRAGDRPLEVAEIACSFVWTGRAAPSAEAFASIEAHVTTAGGAGWSNCSGAAPATGAAVVDEGPPPLTPVHGCDVCVDGDEILMLFDNQIFGLVESNGGFTRVNVTRSDGETLRMIVPGTTPGPLRVALPEPPPGTHWIEGPVFPFD